MASDYGLNFGFRRSDESNATREGRFKTPADGDALLLGTAVQVDPAEPGYMKQCAANAAPVRGLHGLLVQEDSHLGSVFEATPYLGHDSIDLGAAKKDKLAVIWGGPSKVWFKNTAAYARGDRAKDAITIVTLTAVVVGDRLGWDGSKWVESDGTTIPHWMAVTAVSSTDYCEAVLTF